MHGQPHIKSIEMCLGICVFQTNQDNSQLKENGVFDHKNV